MCVKFVEKIHNCVGLKRRATDDDMLFRMCPMRRIRTTQFLSFHPGERQLFKLWTTRQITFVSRRDRRNSLKIYLCWKNNECYANHNYHVELRRPNVRYEVTVPYRRKRNDHVISSLKKAQMTVTGPLEMLYTANAVNTINDRDIVIDVQVETKSPT